MHSDFTLNSHFTVNYRIILNYRFTLSLLWHSVVTLRWNESKYELKVKWNFKVKSELNEKFELKMKQIFKVKFRKVKMEW